MNKQIIRQRAIVSDDYVEVADDAELPVSGKVIVSLARWNAHHEGLLIRFESVGVRIASDKLPKDIHELGSLALVAIEFPRFSDGRGYSIARLLRREAFQGEIRAVGWVLRDNLLYMERCGIDAYDLLPGKSLESAVQAFGELDVVYQATVPDPRPLYRRR